MTDFYVYVHRKKATNEVFYVGKGQGDRKSSVDSRNKFWKNLTKKYKYVIEIVENNLQEWAAFELEKNLIALYGRRDLKEGPLVNLTDGGEGASGHVWTDELKQWRSNKTKEQMSSMDMRKVLRERKLGKKLTEETCLNFSKVAKDTWDRSKERKENLSERMKNKWKEDIDFKKKMSLKAKSLKHTKEAKQKISAAHSKKVKRSDGVVFISVAEAAKELGRNHSKISMAARGKRKTAYGFTWEYV